MNRKKTTTIRFDIENYEYIKKIGKFNNRTISGQANWFLKVIFCLKEEHPELYLKITYKIDMLHQGNSL